MAAKIMGFTLYDASFLKQTLYWLFILSLFLIQSSQNDGVSFLLTYTLVQSSRFAISGLWKQTPLETFYRTNGPGISRLLLVLDSVQGQGETVLHLIPSHHGTLGIHTHAGKPKCHLCRWVAAGSIHTEACC